MKTNYSIIRNTGISMLAVIISLAGGPAVALGENNAAHKDRHYASEQGNAKFGNFNAVELKATELPAASRSNGNVKNAAKIDQMLQAQLSTIFPNLKVVPEGRDFSRHSRRTLQITPGIVKIHIVSFPARFWFSLMAGSSDIAMHLDYRDSSSGKIIASQDFKQSNNPLEGFLTFGITDSQAMEAVVKQITDYTQKNK